MHAALSVPRSEFGFLGFWLPSLASFSCFPRGCEVLGEVLSVVRPCVGARFWGAG